MFPQEPRRPENQGVQFVRSRTKLGLETPLEGRFWGENKRLLFAPPLWYDSFVVVVLVVGVLMAIGGFFNLFPFIASSIWFLTGLAVIASAILGFLSSERMTVDLRQKTYARREGQGPFKRVTRGPVSEIDAMVLQASEFIAPTLNGRAVTYRLVLFWKNNKEPLLVCERFNAAVPFGSPFNAGAGVMLQKGIRYAKEMGLPFYDNSHFNQPDPQRFI